MKIEVRVAYDRRSGSPFRHYRAEDFNLSTSPIRIQHSGASVEVVESNLLRINPLEGEFEIIVTGFDRNRDIFISSRQVVVQCQD